MRLFLPAALVIVLSPAVYAGSRDLDRYAADYICSKAGETGKSRLALYPLTTEEGDTTSETQALTTRIMELVIGKGGFRVIAPEQVSKVLEEQEKGMTGIIDSETAPETGKILGADVLVYSTYGTTRIQVRMIDAVTGEMVGATVSDMGGKTPSVQNDDMTKPGARDEFQIKQLNHKLKHYFRTKPFVYMYMTSNDEEMKQLEISYPEETGKLNRRLARLKLKQKRYNRFKTKVMDLRQRNPLFDQKIRESHQSLAAVMQNRKKKHDDDDD